MSDICFRLWHFDDAPEQYRALSQHGGDEDWVLHCPAALVDGGPSALWPVLYGEENYVDGWGHTDRHVMENGDLVVILAHA